MKFEEAGRAVDQELTKLREFLGQKVKTATRQDTANLLRKTAERLVKLAESLEQPEGGKQ
jgi:hypothetical protein